MRGVPAHFGRQLGRHVLAEQLGDLALAAGGGKKTVGSVERIQAEQRQHRRRHRHHHEARPRCAIGGQQQGQQRNAGSQPDGRPEPQQHRRQQGAQQQHGDQPRVVRPRRRGAGGAVEHAGDQMGMDLDPREGVGKRRHAQVGQSRRGRTQQHDAVFQLLQRRLALQYPGRRNVGERRTGTVRHMHAAVRAERNAKAAHLQPRRSILPPQQGLPIDAGMERIAAERHPQGGGRQRHVIARAIAADQIHLARRAIRVGPHVEESRTLGRVLENSQVRAVARGRRHARSQRRERRSWQGRRRQRAGFGLAVALRNEVIAERQRAFGEHLRKAGVVIEARREPFERRPEIAAARQIALRQLLEGSEPRARVRFGKHHVETDRRHAIAVEQLPDQRAHGVAAPRPAAEAFQAGLVDVEDGDAVIRPAWRSALQPGVIQPGLGALHRRDVDQSRDMRGDQQDKQRRQPGLRQPGQTALHRMR